MIYLTIHETNENFSGLINQALLGEEIVIMKRGIPILKLIPYKDSDKDKNQGKINKLKLRKRKGGQFKGLMKISDDFDKPLPPEYIKLYYGDYDTYEFRF